jgi:hypothetical protein
MTVCFGTVGWGTALQYIAEWRFVLAQCLRHCATSQKVAGSLEFSLKSFRLQYGAGVESVSKRNEYQKYFLGGNGDRCLGLINLPPSCAECHKIWEPQPPGTLSACPGLYRDCCTLSNGDWKRAKMHPYLNINCYPCIYLVVVSGGRLTSRCWMFWSRIANWPIPNESIQHYFRPNVPGRCDICSVVTFVVTEYQGQWVLILDKKKEAFQVYLYTRRLRNYVTPATDLQ